MTFHRRLPSAAGTPVELSRRGFLLTGGTAATATLLPGCASDDTGGVRGPTSGPSTTAVSRARRFFTPAEAATVEAATARILPGTPDDPGAREAEVVVYIDGLLESGGWASEPIYRSGPFLTPDEIEQGDPSEDEDEGGGEGEGGDIETTDFGVVRRPNGEWDRYGLQSRMTPAEVYRTGIPMLDAHAVERFGAPFVGLDDGQQDEVLADLEGDRAETFEQPSGPDLFALLHQHTIEGMFSDPIYGGNRGKVGWQLIGWPAAQRAYTIDELQSEAPPREPRSIEELPHLHGHDRGPGGANGGEPVRPLAGSEERDRSGRSDNRGSDSRGSDSRGSGGGRRGGSGR